MRAITQASGGLLSAAGQAFRKAALAEIIRLGADPAPEDTDTDIELARRLVELSQVEPPAVE